MKIKKKKTRKERAKNLKMEHKNGQEQHQEPQETNEGPIAVGITVHNDKVALKLSRKADLIILDIKAFWQMVEIVKMKAPKEEPKVKGIRLYDAFGKEVH